MKWIKNGQEIILTDRGRPVGRIVPMEKEALPIVGALNFARIPNRESRPGFAIVRCLRAADSASSCTARPFMGWNPL